MSAQLNGPFLIGFDIHYVQIIIFLGLDPPEELERKRLCRIITRDYSTVFCCGVTN